MLDVPLLDHLEGDVLALKIPVGHPYPALLGQAEIALAATAVDLHRTGDGVAHLGENAEDDVGRHGVEEQALADFHDGLAEEVVPDPAVHEIHLAQEDVGQDVEVEGLLVTAIDDFPLLVAENREAVHVSPP